VDRSRSGRLTSASNDENSATILQSFIETPNTSTRKVATKNESPATENQPIICVIFK